MTYYYNPNSAEALAAGAVVESNSIVNNYAGADVPTSHDDADDGYSVGSVWYDTAHGTWYICQVATPGSAIWVQVLAISAFGDLYVYAGSMNLQGFYVNITTTGNHIVLTGIPDTDPHVAGALYNSSGAVKISAG